MRILVFYPHAVQHEIENVAAGRAPTDRLYGLVELRAGGHDVRVADARFQSRFGGVTKWLRKHSVNVCDPGTLFRLRDHDVIVVKDDFSTMLTLGCRAAGRPVVYVDALFEPPRRAWKDVAMRINLRAADGIVVYSRTQIDLWAARYGLPASRFTHLPYTIDVGFYRPVPPPAPAGRPYVLSIGRDTGRQFATLLRAVEGLDVDVKLVTLPYLLRGLDVNRPGVEVLQHLSYDELFRLYAGALLVAIPLKPDIRYPSGVRGLLEAMALGCPVVSSRTDVLEEYAREGEGVTYVEAGDVESLRERLRSLRDDAAARASLAAAGHRLVRERYDMPVFARGLERYLTTLVGTPRSAAA